MNDQMSRKELAARWERSVGTLANWATEGKGAQAYRSHGKQVYYLLAEVEAYERANYMGRL